MSLSLHDQVCGGLIHGGAREELQRRRVQGGAAGSGRDGKFASGVAGLRLFIALEEDKQGQWGPWPPGFLNFLL